MADNPKRNKEKRVRVCSICNLPFHDKRNCPNRDDPNFVPDCDTYASIENEQNDNTPPNEQQQQDDIVRTIDVNKSICIEVSEEAMILGRKDDSGSNDHSTFGEKFNG